MTLDEKTANNFSKGCLDYAKKVSEEIKNYGGMTIYAGGDDLLAIVPVLGKEEENIFSLCKKINNIFDENVGTKGNVPMISIGVAIRFIKFPLYEALSAANAALRKSKDYEFITDENIKIKNNLSIDLQKHSGQSIKLTIPFGNITVSGKETDRMDFLSNFMKENVSNGNTDSSSDTVQTVHSLIYILETFSAMISLKKTSLDDIKNIFKNLYDNASQARFKTYVDFMAENFNSLALEDSNRKIHVYGMKENQYDDDIKTFEALLRIKKFMTKEVFGEA